MQVIAAILVWRLSKGRRDTASRLLVKSAACVIARSLGRLDWLLRSFLRHVPPPSFMLTCHPEREFYAAIVNRRYAPRPQARFFTRRVRRRRARHALHYVSFLYFGCSPEVLTQLSRSMSHKRHDDKYVRESLICSWLRSKKRRRTVNRLLNRISYRRSVATRNRLRVFSDTFIVWPWQGENYSNDGGLSETAVSTAKCWPESCLRRNERSDNSFDFPLVPVIKKVACVC